MPAGHIIYVGVKCPSIRAASASAASIPPILSTSWSSVHPSGPRRPPRPRRRPMMIVPLECPSIRAASASAANAPRPPWRARRRVHPSGPRRPPRPHGAVGHGHQPDVSIHQGRVGLRGPGHREFLSRILPVSIHQGRVGLRGPDEGQHARRPYACVHPSGPRRPPRPAVDHPCERPQACPSIRAASASAAKRRSTSRPCVACVHPSGPRRPPRPEMSPRP